ncbi:MAG: phosphoenolpyruvate carboxykinase (GTP) [Clostridia bacterium]|nr:phosphoenolpyruvate carboxykinase (GTP) [Clostridia bacterium]
MTSNYHLKNWINETAAMTSPDRIVWIDGSAEQKKELEEQAVKTGELIRLNQEKYPGCFLHRTAVNDVARVEGRTFICTRKKEDAGNINNWIDPEECYARLKKIFRGSMRGRTMYVIPYSMGPVGSEFSKIGIELTDSIYVVLNMLIMTRAGKKVLDMLGDSPDFIKGLHSKAELDENNRYICHFPEDNTIWSVNSGYGGNVLLGKKCFALRIASYLGRKEGWMAEHMLILGIQYPDGEIKYIAAAFPSACGKTNLAMLVPPDFLRKKGYRIYCVGDDIAWLRIGKDGRLWAVNPENGFFGVAPGTNEKTNPNALATTVRNTIFTNVALNTDDNTVWWEGLDDCPPEHCIDWRGNEWHYENYRKDDKTTCAAHPNSRFTAPMENCPCLTADHETTEGFPISAIVFGGRRAKTAPLVYQSFNWQHGTFVGSILASETTAAASGQVGVVRRDPMAMRPFVGYNMGDYFAHWLEMGKKIPCPPPIFNVNWFRTDENGHFIWPGFGDNLRVILWILERAAGNAEAVRTPVGYVPAEGGIDLTGLKLKNDDVAKLLEIDRDAWLKDAENIGEFYDMIGDRMPHELYDELDALKKRLSE